MCVLFCFLPVWLLSHATEANCHSFDQSRDNIREAIYNLIRTALIISFTSVNAKQGQPLCIDIRCIFTVKRKI